MRKRNYYFIAGRWATKKETATAKRLNAVLINGSIGFVRESEDMGKCYGLVPEHLSKFKPRTRKPKEAADVC